MNEVKNYANYLHRVQAESEAKAMRSMRLCSAEEDEIRKLEETERDLIKRLTET